MKEIEKRILLKLLENSSKNISQIAKELKISRQTVSKKINDMVKTGIIRRFSIDVNREKIGLKTKAYILIREVPDSKIREENEDKIREMREVSEFYYLLGSYDVVIEVAVKDEGELRKVIRALHKMEGIEKTETLLVHGIVKEDMGDPIKRVLLNESDRFK